MICLLLYSKNLHFDRALIFLLKIWFCLA
uniref:Uncharacterized protein n=1 Tax=Rhizophora mucronata TaxID=61149 RepID=A0A2P2N6H1_RHIMU